MLGPGADLVGRRFLRVVRVHGAAGFADRRRLVAAADIGLDLHVFLVPAQAGLGGEVIVGAVVAAVHWRNLAGGINGINTVGLALIS